MSVSLFHLHGDLSEYRFPRLLATLSQEKFTGVIQTTVFPTREGEDDIGSTREIHFCQGRIAWAISTEKDQNLKSYLIRHGEITAAQWAMAEEKAKDGTLRQALTDLELVGAKQLTQIEKGRSEEIVLSLFSARKGEFRVRERQLSPGTPNLDIDPVPLILKGILETADRTLVQEEVGDLATVFSVSRPVLEGIQPSLPGEFGSVLRHVNGENSIAAICSLTSLPDQFVCSILAALGMVGAIRKGKSGADSAVAETRPLPKVKAPAPAQMDLAPVKSPSSGAKEPSPRPATPSPPPPPPAMAPRTPPPSPLLSRPETAPDKQAAPARTVEPSRAGPPVPSVYDREAGVPDGSRPWFLLGGAAAVAVITIFLVLMAQDPGDASVGQAERGAPAPEASGTPPAVVPEPAENPAPREPREKADIPAQAVADSPPTVMLDGSESLLAGDYRAAALYFGEQAPSGGNPYTIQLVMACQDDTIKRAVEGSGRSSRLFILSTIFEGRDCYRVYWGRYPTEKNAADALRREVPEFFRKDRNPPRIVRLAGS